MKFYDWIILAFAILTLWMVWAFLHHYPIPHRP